MGIFDKLKNPASVKAPAPAQGCGNKIKKVVFPKLPESFEEFKSLPEAQLSDPFDAAALTVLAFCFYSENKEECFKMLDYLRGPRPLSVMDKQFIADRFRDKDYVPRSYFKGATNTPC